MAISTKELYEKSLELSEQERTALAGLILENLEPADTQAEQAWLEEIEKRISDRETGTTELVSWDSVRAKLSRKLNASTENS